MSDDLMKLVDKYGEECARVEYLAQCDQCRPEHEQAKQEARDAVVAALSAEAPAAPFTKTELEVMAQGVAALNFLKYEALFRKIDAIAAQPKAEGSAL